MLLWRLRVAAAARDDRRDTLPLFLLQTRKQTNIDGDSSCSSSEAIDDDDDDDDDRRLAKRITQHAYTALGLGLRVAVLCEAVSLRCSSEGAGAEL